MTATPEFAPRYEVTREERRARNFAAAGLVLGILGVLLALTPLLGLLCAVVGLVLAIKARRLANYHLGMASAALVLSLIGLVIGGLATLAWIGAAFFGAAWFEGWLPSGLYGGGGAR